MLVVLVLAVLVLAVLAVVVVVAPSHLRRQVRLHLYVD